MARITQSLSLVQVGRAKPKGRGCEWRAIFFALLVFFFVAFAGMAKQAFAETLAPVGEWVSPGFDFSITFKLEEGKVLFREEGRSSERQVVIVKEAGRVFHLAPLSMKERLGPGNRGFELTWLNNDAMLFAGGCVGGFLLVRKEAGLVVADKPPVKGRFGVLGENGASVWVIDLAKGVSLKRGKERPLNMRPSPFKDAVRLDLDRTTFDVRLVGDSILALYAWDKHAQKSMPPFGLVAVP